MAESYTRQLGHYADRPYFPTVRATPNFDNAAEFAVTVHYNDPERERTVELARIDTAHGFVHFDKLYRRDRPKEPVDPDLWGAADRLTEDWRRYAEQHESAHERPARPATAVHAASNRASTASAS